MAGISQFISCDGLSTGYDCDDLSAYSLTIGSVLNFGGTCWTYTGCGLCTSGTNLTGATVTAGPGDCTLCCGATYDFTPPDGFPVQPPGGPSYTVLTMNYALLGTKGSNAWTALEPYFSTFRIGNIEWTFTVGAAYDGTTWTIDVNWSWYNVVIYAAGGGHQYYTGTGGPCIESVDSNGGWTYSSGVWPGTPTDIGDYAYPGFINATCIGSDNCACLLQDNAGPWYPTLTGTVWTWSGGGSYVTLDTSTTPPSWGGGGNYGMGMTGTPTFDNTTMQITGGAFVWGCDSEGGFCSCGASF